MRPGYSHFLNQFSGVRSLASQDAVQLMARYKAPNAPN